AVRRRLDPLRHLPRALRRGLGQRPRPRRVLRPRPRGDPPCPPALGAVRRRPRRGAAPHRRAHRVHLPRRVLPLRALHGLRRRGHVDLPPPGIHRRGRAALQLRARRRRPPDAAHAHRDGCPPPPPRLIRPPRTTRAFEVRALSATHHVC